MSVIKSTRNYDMFLRMKGNRDIDRRHLSRLIKSVDETGVENVEFPPITVNERFEVVDGQHRLEVCKHFNIPVSYIVKQGAGLATIHAMNTNVKAWDSDDFMKSYIEKGLEDYKIYKEFKEHYGYPHQIAQLLLSGVLRGGFNEEKNSSEIFRSGLFKIRDLKEAERNSEMLARIQPFYAGCKRRSFVYALLRCLKNKDFDFERLMRKLEYHSVKLVNCTSTDQYLELLESIYNFNAKANERLNLRF